jgi:hypothetical protein
MSCDYWLCPGNRAGIRLCGNCVPELVELGRGVSEARAMLQRTWKDPIDIVTRNFRDSSCPFQVRRVRSLNARLC